MRHHPDRLRVLQIFNDYLEKGGEEASVRRIRRTLREVTEIDSCLFSAREWLGERRVPAWKQALLMWRNPEALRRIAAIHERLEPDLWLLHNVMPVGSAAIFSEAHRRRVPVVQYIHNYRPFSVNGYLWAGDRVETSGLHRDFGPEIRAGAWQNSRVKTWWYAGILRHLHRSGAFDRVRTWIAISEFMRRTFIEAGVPEHRVVTLRHSWNARPDPGIEAEGDGSYLFLGRLTEMKGIRTLLEAWRILRGELGSATPLLRIAGTGPLAETVAEEARADDRLEYLGAIEGEAKSDALRACRAVLVPSTWWEPLGLVVYEGYDHGRPVVASAVGGLAETVEDGRTGLLHPPGDAPALAACVLRLERDPAEARALGRAGRAWLLANADPVAWRTRCLDILRQAVACPE